MVSYSYQALDDFDAILYSFLHWEKIVLSAEFTIEYIQDIKNQCENIPYVSHHFPATYPEHKRFGNFIHRYRRNARTVWYIVYDKDPDGNIFINRIVSNHLTQ